MQTWIPLTLAALLAGCAATSEPAPEPAPAPAPVAVAPAPTPAPAPAAPAAAPAPAAPAGLDAAVASALRKSGVPYRHALADLNADGKPDAIVLLQDSEWCGSGGCTMLVFRAQADGRYALLSKSTVTDTPIRVGTGPAKGWKPLIVRSGGRNVVLRPGKAGYPANPSTQPAATEAALSAAKVVLQD